MKPPRLEIFWTLNLKATQNSNSAKPNLLKTKVFDSSKFGKTRTRKLKFKIQSDKNRGIYKHRAYELHRTL